MFTGCSKLILPSLTSITSAFCFSLISSRTSWKCSPPYPMIFPGSEHSMKSFIPRDSMKLYDKFTGSMLTSVLRSSNCYDPRKDVSSRITIRSSQTAYEDSRRIDVIIQMEWSSVVKEFRASQAALNASRNYFNDEVRLADVQEQEKRHQDLVVRIESLSSLVTDRTVKTVSTLTLQRNHRFTGRRSELLQLHNSLQVNRDRVDQSHSPSRRSCVIHGIGGIGKTQTAVEYVYIYKASYSHIFWMHSESNATLLESFMSAMRKLEMYDQSLQVERMIEKGIDWLQHSGMFFVKTLSG